MSSFPETSSELLARLKHEWADLIPRGRSPDKKLMEYVSGEVRADDISDFIIRDRIFPTLSPERKLAAEEIAVGILDTPTLNAVCVINDSNRHAILINRGLLHFLNMFTRYTMAALDPTTVEYCESIKPSKATPDIYFALRGLLVANYVKHHAPVSAFIALAGIGAETQAQVFVKMVAFIIGHEFAHYFHGDLTERKNFSPLQGVSRAYAFTGNRSWDQEFAADLEAYRILLALNASFYPTQFSEANALCTLLGLFDAFAHISDLESATHPSPKQRINNIANHFYSKRLPEGYNGNALPLQTAL